MNHKNAREKGSATLEFALAVSLVLAPLLLGLVDFSRYLDVSHAVSRAAHEGVFEAARGHEPLPIVQSHVASAGLDPAKVSVSLSPALGAAARGTPMQITVSYNLTGYALATWGGLFPQALSTKATARHE
ncbi:MAG: pilus assembly protein [Proteobacteria bacterium]|nr:pilus assembly protein [Pseudomonadota bacterium]MBU1594129.1 pilus assembly protein [Pseudomonadota bacterium]